MEQDEKYDKVPETCGFDSQERNLSSYSGRKMSPSEERKARLHDSCPHSETRPPSCESKKPKCKKKKVISKVCAKDCLNDLYKEFAEPFWELPCTIPEHSEQKIPR